MVNFLPSSSQNHEKGKLIPQIKLEGPEQMALDVMLLEESLKSSTFSIALRFYTWKGPWLSIGKNQKHIPEKWATLLEQKKLQIVRRPSGGRAVLHSQGLTYALIWKSPPRKKREAYIKANQWLIKGFSDLGLELEFGSQFISSPTLASDCFSTSTPADLVDQYGNKRIGSAQHWRKGHLLQHGEILLDPPKKLWIEVFGEKPPKPATKEIPRKGLEKALQAAMKSCWPKVKWQIKQVTKEELIEAKRRAHHFSLNVPEEGSSTIPSESMVSTI